MTLHVNLGKFCGNCFIAHLSLTKSLKTLSKGMEKMRTVGDDKLQMKEYLQKTTLNEASAIMKMRLHMTNVPPVWRE